MPRHPTPVLGVLEYLNAAQAWNHTFYWNSIKSGGGGAPTGELAQKIEADLGGYDKFVDAFKTAGATQFGSGAVLRS